MKAHISHSVSIDCAIISGSVGVIRMSFELAPKACKNRAKPSRGGDGRGGQALIFALILPLQQQFFDFGDGSGGVEAFGAGLGAV